MRFHGDLTQASPVIRETYMYNSSATGIVAGSVVSVVAINASEGKGGVILATVAEPIDVLGVVASVPASCISVIATGVEKYGKVIVNPCAYFLAEWDDGANTCTVASTTGEVITDTGIDATNEGAWAYIYGPSTDTGYGNLIKVGAQTTTTVLTNVTGTAYDDELKANTTASTYTLIRAPYVGAPTLGAIDLSTAGTKLTGGIACTGSLMVLENYINHSRFPMEPLRTENHCGKNVPGAKFYGDLYIMDHILRSGILP